MDTSEIKDKKIIYFLVKGNLVKHFKCYFYVSESRHNSLQQRHTFGQDVKNFLVSICLDFLNFQVILYIKKNIYTYIFFYIKLPENFRNLDI